MPDHHAEGYEAYINGEPMSSCPYEDPEFASEWEGGWMEAEEEHG